MKALLEKTSFALVGLVMLWLVGMILFGRNGYFDYQELKQRRDQIIADNRTIETRNAELRRQITRLQSDPEYIAHVARQELGMVEKDEVIYLYRSGVIGQGKNSHEE